MKDQYQRVVDYIRISVTDRCNYRCQYCMPREGVEPMPHSEVMTYDEILRLVKAAAGAGITKVKITGGEPLVRKGVCGLIRNIRLVPGIESVTLTTNGALLCRFLPDLAAAGVSGINISLDTLDKDKFHRLTRRGEFSEVWEGIRQTILAGIPVKVNCVPMVGINEDELVDMAALAWKYPITVRFIEMMPIGLGSGYTAVTQDEIKKLLEAQFGYMELVKESVGNGPAVYYQLPEFRGKIGFISALSRKFCRSCNRIRVKADGTLKLCLNYEGHINLKQEMRNGIDDRELQQLLQDCIYMKPKCHDFPSRAWPTAENGVPGIFGNGNSPEERVKGILQETHNMAQIGG
ncbi:GTP 3',8-cyclase MoaA [Schaedlerella arabinosiphila]|uniref:GTP 3',8-cyclase MoaA n=1 Tax=Schaedlerella arabinosiphila TaxID=2044587 RepID=UPI0025583284|nr:GTP 3',8-cyclase MoaA [Schaedlerella arabinosiphila]MCI9633477.1 GTP 3',8-cyclase MoaA [Ruminococcus sp.]